MPNNTRVITVQCQCGASFEREVKRGRPQLWCPACVAVPFYERVRAQAVVTEAGTVVEAVANPNDPLWAVRSDLEAAVAECNAEHKASYAAAVKAGADKYVAAAAMQAALATSLNEVYAKYRSM